MKKIALISLSLSVIASTLAAEPEAPDAGTFAVTELPARVVIEGRLPKGVAYFSAGYADYKPLLAYIDDNDIEPRLPVEADPGAAPAALAFPLRDADAGREFRAADRVARRTLPATTVARHVFRGGYDKETLDQAEKKLRERLAKDFPGWRVAGAVTYAYWSPYYYPPFLKKAEVRIPVRPAAPVEPKAGDVSGEKPAAPAPGQVSP